MARMSSVTFGSTLEMSITVSSNRLAPDTFGSQLVYSLVMAYLLATFFAASDAPDYHDAHQALLRSLRWCIVVSERSVGWSPLYACSELQKEKLRA